MPIALAKRSIPDVDQSAGKNTLARNNSFLRRPFRTVAMWFARSAERSELRELAKNRHLLNDIGLSREQVINEAVKPFWCR